jgi:hypothetical protein
MRRRHQPKRFAPPRSRRAREAAAPPYSATDILKEIYHDGWTRPEWAKLAYARGWMVAGEFYAIEPSERIESPFEVLYRESPMFGLLKKETF